MRTHAIHGHTVHPGTAAWRRFSRALLLITAAAAIGPSSAAAQTMPGQRSPASSWDVTAVAGFVASRPEIIQPSRDVYRDDWYDTAHGGFILGRHLSTHLKTEFELSASAEGRQYVQQFVSIPIYPQPVFYATDRFSTLRHVSGSVIWQFLENEWVHPFLLAGVSADFERVRSRTLPQTFYVGDPRLPGSRVVLAQERNEGPETTLTVRPLLGAGAKFYATPRVFLRTDGRVGSNGKTHHVALRLGLGVDF